MLDTTELEQWIIGGLLNNNHALLDLNLKSENFFYPIHRAVFERMQSLMDQKGGFSLADFNGWNLSETLADQVPDGMQVSEYLRECARTTLAFPGHTSGIKNYADNLLDTYRKSLLMDLFDTLKARIHERSYTDLCSEIMRLVEQREVAGLKSGQEIYNSILDGLKLPAKHFKTGLSMLDEVMAGGLYEGYTYGFCGAEKSGKTTLAHTISYNLSQNGTKHLYVALEMGSEQIEQRNIARDLRVNSIKFLNSVQSLIPQMKMVLPRQNVWYYDAPGATLSEILNMVTQAKARHEISGFIVDYWQLVQGKDARETEEKHLRDVAQGLANYSRKNGLWCILLAQMNQDGRLFGGNGLRKACDQLYMIEQNEGSETQRWLRMDASRYTMRVDCGAETDPSLMMNKHIGPFFECTRNSLFEKESA